MNREGPATTDEAPGTTGKALGTTETAPPRQSYGNAPVNAVRVPKTGALPERHRHSPGLRRGITGNDRVETGALPAGGVTVRCRLSPGLNRGTTGNKRGYAGTLPPFTGALPATTGTLPGLHRDKPYPVRVDRAVDRLQPGRHREIV
ncbi:hypothetical protein DPMN_120820 [Dreissena polymorpha]|uniref:Uncharacterized protein n=1 Tax=Dreissena polymorpha TaxID=45954 RepID=A0A9D4GPA5_DREPO|nr:hypothetical protein DPMN_120820 [Dreissena polymorpha]